MTPEQQKALALARARVRLQSQQAPAVQTPEAVSEDPGMLENIGRGAAKGASSMLAFPAEVALGIPKAGAYLAGDESALDFLSGFKPTEAFQEMLGMAGVRTDPQPNTFGERFASNAAEAVTGGLVGIGAGSMASGVIRAGTKRLMEGRLGRFAAEDALAATAGATARSVAQEAGLNDPAAGVSEFAASFLTGGLLGKARGLSDLYHSDPLTKYKANERQRASEFVRMPLQMAGEDPAVAAASIRTGGPSGTELLTSGARSGSTALQSLENTLIKNNPELQARFADSKKDLNTFISDELRIALGGDGVSQDFIDNYRQSADWATHITEKNRQVAMERMFKEIGELPPMDADYSTPIKRQLEEMKRVDRQIEKDLWSQTGAEDLVVESMDPARPFLKEAYDSLLQESAKAGRVAATLAMPDKVILGAVKEIADSGTASVDEIIALRSSLLDAAAEASANRNDNLARRLNGLAEGALNTLEGASGANAEAIKQARQFSRDLNDRYSRDVVGPLLSRSASRGESVAANETMERIFTSGEKGRTNLRAINLAMGGIPQDAKSYILQQFYRKAVGEDGINVKSAESFIKSYQPALEEAGLLNTVSAYVVTGRAVNRANLELAELTSAQAADATAKMLKNYGGTGDDLVNFIGGTLKSEARASQAVLSEMYQNASTDLSGAALRGLQSATVDAALRTMYTAGGDATAKLPEITTRVVNALEATGNFTPEQIDRVTQLGGILQKQASSERLRVFKGQSNTPQDLASASFVSMLARMTGLHAAGLVKPKGPGAMSFAGLVGRGFQKVAEKITKDDAESLIKAAVFDPEIMAALLENPAGMSAKSQSVISNFLKGVARFAVIGGARPSQATIVPETAGSIIDKFNETEQENGR